MARPREFDPQDALDTVMAVFWRDGYEGASLQDFEAATGLNKQSLYRIFPDKRAMYLAALARYEETETQPAREFLSRDTTARHRFSPVFTGLVDLAAKGDRRGCFLCNAATDQAQLDGQARAFVRAAMQRLEKLFRDGLKVSAPYDRDAEARKAKAAELLSIYFGLRVLTRANAPASTIKAAARQAIAGI